MYQWMVNGVAAGTDSSSYTYDPANGDVVTAMLTSSQACATGTATGAPLTLAVITSVTPSVTTASLQDSVCQGATEFFYAVPTNGGTSPTYSFVYNGVVVQTGPGLTYSALPASGDHVYVIMATSALCHTGSDSVTGNTITLYVQEPMIPVVSISANDSNVSSSASVTFTATATNTTTTAYQWYIDGSPVPGATNSTYTGSGFTDGDVVSCTVSNNDVCGTHSGSGYKTVHVIAEGVKQITLNGGDITVTPNPSQGDFIVKGTLASSNDVQLSLEVTNMLGQVVYNTMVTAANGKINEHIRLSSSVANGMYLLNLRSGGEIAVFHIVVEK
jgi:hypothetical protein